MEWFAVTSAVTTSLAWAGADACARGAWVSLADVCRQTMTEGRIRDGRTQMHRVCRLARVEVADLRAAIDAGLIVEDGDDVVLIGWDHPKEREALRAVQRARESRQRRHGRSEGIEVVVAAGADASVPVAADADAKADVDTPSADRTSDPPFANAPPHANPNFGTEERRGDQMRGEETRTTPPPSPQGASGQPTRTGDDIHAATAATALGHLPGSTHEPRANSTHEESPTAPDRTDESPPPPPPRPQGLAPLAPKRSRLAALPALRSAALADQALGIVTALGGCLRGPGGADYTAEWQRELTGMDAREVLAMCLTAGEPIRLPSGLRRERDVWRRLSLDERRDIVHQVCATHGIPIEKRPPPAAQPSP